MALASAPAPAAAPSRLSRRCRRTCPARAGTSSLTEAGDPHLKVSVDNTSASTVVTIRATNRHVVQRVTRREQRRAVPPWTWRGNAAHRCGAAGRR